MKRDERVLGLLLGIGIAGLLASYMACMERRQRNPNSPTVITSAAATPEPVATAVPYGNGDGRELEFGRNGQVSIKNTSGVRQQYVLCSFRVYPGGEQQRASMIAAEIASGETWSTQGLGQCSQLDMIQPPVTCDGLDWVLGFAYYGKDGKPKFSSGYVNWSECDDPKPTPSPRTTPTPSPTPTPCSTWKHTKGCKY